MEVPSCFKAGSIPAAYYLQCQLVMLSLHAHGVDCCLLMQYMRDTTQVYVIKRHDYVCNLMLKMLAYNSMTYIVGDRFPEPDFLMPAGALPCRAWTELLNAVKEECSQIALNAAVRSVINGDRVWLEWVR